MLGRPVADFSLPGTGGSTFRLSDRGTKLVLYFYPKDSTPGCTRIYGFKVRMKFPFELFSSAASSR